MGTPSPDLPPLSFAQERLWFLDRLEPGRSTYNLPALCIRLRGSLNQGVLRRALDEIARRQESLRTTFAEVDGRPVQVIAPPAPLPLPLVDLRALPSLAVREAEARALARAEAGRPFDLARGPLTRALLLRLGVADHLFVLAQHHIVSDGWSLGILQSELGALYSAFILGRRSPLPELPLQPAALSLRQRRRLQGETLASLLGWWRERLGGSLPLLDLPADHPRPAVQSFHGGYASFPLGEEAGGARELGTAERATPFMVLFAAFVALLHRATGQTDLLVGFPVAGRDAPEVEGVAGFFVNTLVLRTDVADDPTFLELLRRVRDGVLESVIRADLPFERLVEELQPGRSLSHSPLVQVLFSFLPVQAATARLPGLDVAPEAAAGSGTAKFDLTLTIEDGPEGMNGLFELRRDLFDPPTARRLGVHFQRLLGSAARRPETRLSELSLLGAAERHQLLVEWNDTRREPPEDLVHALFAEQARARPDAPALVFEGAVTTYGELAARAGRLARRLRALGVGGESRVGVCLERSPELIVALLGVLTAGGAYVPLDPAQPPQRRLALLRECGASVLLTRGALADGFDGFAGTVLALDGGEVSGPVETAEGEPPPVTPDHLAYVIFTSGSTGTPKGVAVPHRAVVRLVRDAGYADLGPREVFLQLAPASFDASTFEIWGCLCNGGRLVIVPPELPSLAALGDVVRREGVTTLWLTAGLFHSLVDAIVDDRLESFAGVRQLLAGGDVLSPTHVRRALAALPGVRLIDGYGPTECTTFACCHPMTALTPPLPPPVTVPVGRPIANTRAYVVDAGLGLVAIGVAGELLLGGDGLARGYQGDPALTAARFVPDPTGGARGGRLYRTGDRARWRPDGRLELLGRSDQQVKIRGFRVEPAEIEAALAAHPALAEAAVVVAGTEAHDRRLVAFAVPRPGGRRPEPAELREWLKGRLPRFMVPAAVALVDALPLTPHGKLDRRALMERAAAVGREVAEGAGTPPRSDLECRLVEIWTDLLRVPVGVHDNFFERGGDSLLALQMVSRAGRAGLPLTLRQLFRHQTVVELAAAVATSPAVVGEQGWVTGPVPQTPGQVWFFDRVASHLEAPHQFSSRSLLEIRAPVSEAMAARAVAWTLFQHDALRLRVERRPEGRWEQRNAGPEALADSWAHIDLALLPDAAQDAAVASAALQLLGRRELEGALARFVLFALGPSRPARLLIVLHHLISDATSWRVLREDLETVLGRLLRGEEVDLPPKTTSFRAWALRQEALARSEELRGQVDHWLRLARVGGQRLPADFPEGDAGTGEVGHATAALGEEDTRALLQGVAGSRFTDALLTAVARAFRRWTGSRSLLIRQTFHGRDPVFDDVDLSRTVGWISTTAPVLLELPDTESPAGALAAIAGQLARLPLGGLGYGLLRYLSGDPEVAASMATVVASPAATFNFLGRFDGPPAAPGLLVEVPLTLDSGPRLPRRDPQLRITAGIAGIAGAPARLLFDWEYGRDFYRRETIERLAESCVEELRGLLGGP
jgi:amino acid adenylation domain-containing protein/non-ribosomal peptide synthase protein (TIGR01720 family)